MCEWEFWPHCLLICWLWESHLILLTLRLLRSKMGIVVLDNLQNGGELYKIILCIYYLASCVAHRKISVICFYFHLVLTAFKGLCKVLGTWKWSYSHTQGKMVLMVLMPLVPSVYNVKEGPYDKYSQITLSKLRSLWELNHHNY